MHVRLAFAALLLVLLALAAGAQEDELEPRKVVPPSPEPAVQAPAEDHLLRELCRYLRLSRRQVGLLLPGARYIERARALFAREEAEAERQADRVRDRPEEVARIAQALEARRARVVDDLVQFSAPQWVRVFTREQVALAWRLLQGQPPVYARAHADLLHPAAGLGSRRSLGGRFLLLERGGQVEYDGLLGELTLNLRSLTLQEAEASVRVRVPQGAGVRLPAPVEKPFPQLVIETDDLRDLIPHVEPLVRRVVLSEQWLPALQDAWTRGPQVRPSRDHRLVARKPTRVVRDYRMERGLRDLTGKGPELEPLGGTLDHGLYHFGPGQGLRLGDTGVRDDYHVEFSFRFEGGENYQKLLDFKKGKQDGGLYTYQGHLTFYTLANGGVPQPGREHRLRLERDRETRVVRGYLDLRPIFAFIDLDDAAVFEDATGMLFVDDVTTKGEQGPGALRWVSFRAPLTP